MIYTEKQFIKDYRGALRENRQRRREKRRFYKVVLVRDKHLRFISENDLGPISHCPITLAAEFKGLSFTSAKKAARWLKMLTSLMNKIIAATDRNPRGYNKNFRCWLLRTARR